MEKRAKEITVALEALAEEINASAEKKGHPRGGICALL
jgi:hypothetical protein